MNNFYLANAASINLNFLIYIRNLYENDTDYWSNNKFSFDKLFKDNSIGVELYKNVERTFTSWYWGIGYRTCTIFFSDCLVEEYYNKIINFAKIKKAKFKINEFYLQVVYDVPPSEWRLKNKNTIIISPQIKLPTVEDFEVLFPSA